MHWCPFELTELCTECWEWPYNSSLKSAMSGESSFITLGNDFRNILQLSQDHHYRSHKHFEYFLEGGEYVSTYISAGVFVSHAKLML